MEKEQLQSQLLSDDEMDLFELWDNLWHHKSLIILLTFFSTALGSGYAFFSNSVYQGTALVQVQQVQFSDNKLQKGYFSIEPESTTEMIINKIAPAALQVNRKVSGVLIITKESSDKSSIRNDITSTYELIKQRHASIFKALQRNDAIEVMPTKLVGDISVSDHPIKPKKGLIISLAMMLGLIIGVFIVLVRSAIEKRKSQGM